MAKPRVFLSSTYYDLYQSREDIERFVRSMGYDCVRHETGAIPYVKDSRLESSAYKEVDNCDLFVTIIGGKFGSESKEFDGSSITQSEITRALERGIQVYIFVEQNTITEYQTWKINKDNKEVAGFKYRYADDVRIYSFLDRLYSLPQNNPITGFRTIAEVTAFLQEQWAGLFQRYLNQHQRMAEVSVLDDMKAVSSTLREMVDFLSRSNQDKTEALSSILLTNHPIFAKLAELTNTPYRVYFANHDEMAAWLRARQFKPGKKESYSKGSVEEWHNEKIGWVEFKHQFFGSTGELIGMSQAEWDDSWLTLLSMATVSDDDIPF